MISLLTRALARLTALFRGPQLDQAVREDLLAHEELLTDDLVACGMDPASARREARLRLGTAASAIDAHRAARSLSWVDETWRDIGLALRRLRRSPGFTFFAVVSLGLGIGATTVVHSVVRATVAPPPGIRGVDAILNVYNSSGAVRRSFSYGDFRDLEHRQTSLEHLAAWASARPSYAANGVAEAAFGEFVSGHYFDLLGVPPSLGRMIQPADDMPGAPPVAVLSHGVWQRLFGEVSDAVGQTIRVNGQSFTVIGVTPPGFLGLFNNGLMPSALWLPLSTVSLARPPGMGFTLDPNARNRTWLRVKGRLRPGISRERAAAEVTAIAEQLDGERPLAAPRGGINSNAASRRWSVAPAADVAINETAGRVVRPLATAVMVAVGLVLLVACTNLANLVLARGAARRQELAVRLALGASRLSLVRGLIIEASVVTVAGAAFGLALARAALVMLGNDVDVGGGTVVRLEPRMDVAVLVGAIAATMLALVVAGIVPALHATRIDLRRAIASEGTQVVPRWRMRRLLIAGQVSVSLLLLAIASTYLNQVRLEARRDPGIDLDRLALAEVHFGAQQYDELRARLVIEAALNSLTRGAGVERASVMSGLPLGAGSMITPGGAVGLDRPSAPVELVAASPAVLATLGVSLVGGRGLDARDIQGAEPVVVLSERAANVVFGHPDVVGRQVLFKRNRWAGEEDHPVQSLTIVGIAADTDTGMVGRRDRGVVYLPLAQHFEPRLLFAVRTAGDPGETAELLRRTLRSIDPELAVAQFGTGEHLAGGVSMFAKVTGSLTGTLGTFALLLALAGLYGVLSHLVSRRTREIGLRMALGASRGAVLRLILREGLAPVVLGIAVGAALGALGRTLLRPLFIPVLPAVDYGWLIGVGLGLVVAALIACYVPARRAASADPWTALRDL